MGILLGDGTPPGLHDVRALLEREGFEILGETGDGPELVHLAVGLRPALVIFDYSTPRVSALEAAHDQHRVLLGGGGEGKAAIAHDDGRDAVPARAAAQRIPEHLRIHVRVPVDETWRHHMARRVDLLFAAFADEPDRRNAVTLDADIRAIPGQPRPQLVRELKRD